LWKSTFNYLKKQLKPTHAQNFKEKELNWVIYFILFCSLFCLFNPNEWINQLRHSQNSKSYSILHCIRFLAWSLNKCKSF
jgi:hypothetical protein